MTPPVESDLRRSLEMLATVGAVGAVLLPLGGVLVRVVAFWTLNADNLRELVLGDSVAGLAFTGFRGILASAPLLAILIFIYRFAPLMLALRSSRSRLARFLEESAAVDADFELLLADIDKLKTSIPADKFADSVKEIERRHEETAKRGQQINDSMKEFGRLIEPSTPWQRQRNRVLYNLGQTPSRVTLTLGTVLGLAMLLFVPDGPTAIPIALAAVIVAYVIPWLIGRGHLHHFAAALVVSAVVVALCSVGAGLAGNTGNQYLATYEFKPEANVRAGRYNHVAESNGLIFLEACSSHEFIAVETSSLANISEAPYTDLPVSPNFWAVIFEHRTPIIGYRSEC